jgi:glutamate synthase (NADPH/NADH) large chain
VGVVLGSVGPAVASGMTGGVLFLLDEDHLAEKVHRSAQKVPLTDGDLQALRALLEEHQRETGSERARGLIASWATAQERFAKVVPRP